MVRLTVTVLVVLAAWPVAAAEDMVPFVIPTTPNPESVLAMEAEPVPVDAGRVVVRDGHFAVGDERVRIWGVNLCSGACFPEREDAPRIARRMAAAGVNSVRFHHMDSRSWPNGILDPKDKTTLHPEALRRLDVFLDALARRGIRANLNLHVGRAVGAALGLPTSNTKYEKIVGIFTPRLIEAQKQYARDLLGRTSTVRKVRYADDPAVAFVEITNEDSLFMWSAKRDLRTLPDYYAKILRGKFNTWLNERYGSTDALRKAWAKGNREGLRDGESLEKANVAVFAPGEDDARVMDRWRFLAETEKAYFDEMRRFIKQDLGYKGLVTGTVVFGPLGLYGQSDMDFIDGHAYWQHPRFPGRPWDSNNWTVRQIAMTDHPEESPLRRLAAQRLAGKPYTVSEYNHPAPNDYQAECVPMLASFASAQDWDGVWLFTYGNNREFMDRSRFRSYFDIGMNPAKWGFVRAGAAIFRQGDFPPLGGRRSVALADAKADPLAALVPMHIDHDRDLFEAVAERAELDWRDLVKTYLAVNLRGRNASGRFMGVPSPNVTWKVDGKQGTYTVRAPGARVFIGHRGSRGAGIDLHAPAFAAVTVTALDGQPLDESRSILVTACGRCENTGMGFSEDRRTVGRNWGEPPVLIEPAEAEVAVPDGPWTCHALKPDGTRGAEVPVEQAADRRQRIGLDPKYGTMWYFLERGK